MIDPGDSEHPAEPSRVRGEVRDLDYDATRSFFETRAARAREGAPPLTAVLYQDANPALAESRDRAEVERVRGWLGLDTRPRVLDIGCGIGRWGEHLHDLASAYQGVDFSAGLVDLARERLGQIWPEGSWSVEVGSATALDRVVFGVAPPFDLVIMAGLLVYLNDDDVVAACRGVVPHLAGRVRIYAREPVATEDRLTLDRHWSEELRQHYSAAYRPAAFYEEVFDDVFGRVGIRLTRSEELDASLRNRAETSQHFFLLERE